MQLTWCLHAVHTCSHARGLHFSRPLSWRTLPAQTATMRVYEARNTTTTTTRHHTVSCSLNSTLEAQRIHSCSPSLPAVAQHLPSLALLAPRECVEYIAHSSPAAAVYSSTASAASTMQPTRRLSRLVHLLRLPRLAHPVTRPSPLLRPRVRLQLCFSPPHSSLAVFCHRAQHRHSGCAASARG